MTDGNPRPEETPAPPTSAGFEEPEAADDEELAPPFVPGSDRPAEPVHETPPEPAAPVEPPASPPAPEGPAAADTETEPAATPAEEPAATRATEPAESEEEPEDYEPFPFETGWDEEAEEEEAVEAEAGIEEGGEADEFPFEAFDIEGGEEGTALEPAEAEDVGPGPVTEAMEPEPEAVETGELEPESIGEDATAEPPAEPPVEPATATPAHELADTLEAMAGRIREEGVEAAREQMSSDDRLTAMLASLLAGYLAGRE